MYIYIFFFICAYIYIYIKKGKLFYGPGGIACQSLTKKYDLLPLILIPWHSDLVQNVGKLIEKYQIWCNKLFIYLSNIQTKHKKYTHSA